MALTFPLYLDHLATTPVDPVVFEAMRPFFSEKFGNASSRSHSFGWEAADAVEKARSQCATLLNADPRGILFTSGATESINMALRGSLPPTGAKLVTTAAEHPAVLDTARDLERRGVKVVILPVDGTGRVDIEAVRREVTGPSTLVSVIAANNEVGTLNPVSALGRAVKEAGGLYHVDASQALGKVPVDARAWQADFISASAHKLYGPKGVGLLWAAEKRLRPLCTGGGQEGALRPGTLNVPGIVGFGEACARARVLMKDEFHRLGTLRDRLQKSLQGSLDGVRVNGHGEKRLPHCLHLSFQGVDGSELLMGLENLALSAGSACASGKPGRSHVLEALGLPEEWKGAVLRFGLGRSTTQEEVDFAASEVIRQVRRLRKLQGVPS